jgi:hypothetical protein
VVAPKTLLRARHTPPAVAIRYEIAAKRLAVSRRRSSSTRSTGLQMATDSGGARTRVADGVGITLIGFIGSDAENGRKINSGVIPVRRADGLGAGVEHVPDCA